MQAIRCSSETGQADSLDAAVVLRQMARGWKEEEGRSMWKIKDLPPDHDFKDWYPQHYKDFLAHVPLPWMTSMRRRAGSIDGVLNLELDLPAWTRQPDLGPKLYVAEGRPEEAVGDSVTKLHLDHADAVNITTQVLGAGEGPVRHGSQNLDVVGFGQAGSLWDIWPLSSLEPLRQHLKASPHLYPKDTLDPILDQVVMLKKADLDELQAAGISPMHFEQYAEEAVFLPAGCAHQVRNLRTCVKVAADFISPSGLAACQQVAGLLGGAARAAKEWSLQVPMIERKYLDKAQSSLAFIEAGIRLAAS